MTASTASASSSLLRDAQINPSDTHLTTTVSLQLSATVQSPRPIHDAVTGQTTNTLVLNAPAERFAVEAGYDDNGAFTFNQYALDPPGDPLRESVSPARTISIHGGRLEILDAGGNYIYGTEPGNGPVLQDIIGASTSEALQMLDDVVTSRAPSVGTTSTSGGIESRVLSVSETRTSVTVNTQITESGEPADTQKRIYRRGWYREWGQVTVDAATGALSWKRSFSGAGWVSTWIRSLTLTDDGTLLLVALEANFTQNAARTAAVIVAVDPATGAERWRFQDGDTTTFRKVGSLTVWNDLILYSDPTGGDTNAGIVALDIATRQVRWRRSLGATFIGTQRAPAVVDGVAYWPPATRRSTPPTRRPVRSGGRTAPAAAATSTTTCAARLSSPTTSS